MNLTRRGGATVAVITVAFALAGLYGARSLNAVAAPAIVALLAGVVQVLRAEPPDVTRFEPPPGFPGEMRTVRLEVDTDTPCTVRDRVSSGVRPVDEPGGEFAGPGRVEYAVELRRRGEHRLGPATATVRDALGLVARGFEGRQRTPLVVYPEVHPVAGRRAFAALVEQAGTPEREAFDRLREYTPGDALRDIDWKSSAKRPDDGFVVTEYAAEDRGAITVAAEADSGHGDEMASAAASVALYLLDARLTVEVVTPSGRCDPGAGDEQRSRVLELLARAETGRIGRDDRAGADVYVHAGREGTGVRVGSRETTFAELVDPGTATGSDADRGDREVVGA